MFDGKSSARDLSLIDLNNEILACSTASSLLIKEQYRKLARTFANDRLGRIEEATPDSRITDISAAAILIPFSSLHP